MQASSHRARELEKLYKSRRERNISISDNNHHVTEAIGHMYEFDHTEAPRRDHNSRPLSFLPSPLGETIDTNVAYFDAFNGSTSPESSRHSPPSLLIPSNDRRGGISSPDRFQSNSASPRSPPDQRSPSSNGNISPASGFGPRSPPIPFHRQNSETASQSFPLNDIDYESSPAAVAQELSNLQAIRRMSMDVNSPMDPDLPSFTSPFGVPPIAPSHNDDEEDPARLYWVPARLHPELAPKEFKTFIQDRVKTIKRSSLSEDHALSPDQGGGSLRRRKSMLSKQIENGVGYEDGSERLLRRQSRSGHPDEQEMNLEELENLVKDPSNIARRMSNEQASRMSADSGSEVPMSEDMPILAAKPGGQTLKRSTRTQYRRGSLKKGGLVSRRQTLRQQADQQEEEAPRLSSDVPQLPNVPTLPDLSDLATGHFGLTRVQTEPITPSKSVENFSRPVRRAQTPPTQHSQSFGFDEAPAVQKPDPNQHQPHSQEDQTPPQFQSRFASNGRSSAPIPSKYSQPIPQIVEPQPSPDHYVPTSPADSRPQSLPVMPPERTSSMDHPSPPQGPLQSRPLQHRPPLIRPQSLPQQNPPVRGVAVPPNNHKPSNITLDDITAGSSMGPGINNRSESLSITTAYADEPRKGDKKSKGKDDGSKKSWGWFSSSNSEEKKEKEEKELAKRSKSKLQRPLEKQDNTRLDVLQTSIDGTKGRESTVFDRQSLHLEEDRKPARKVSGEVKKDSSLFSSLFGSSKKKGDKETGTSSKKGSSLRGLSPDPPPRILRPDVDYNWSRFSILEERAIYRMAHIKLANPRRELYSQVLLSNFMYSYLAKVQQMHPQIQIPQSAAQKQAQRAERQQQKKQEAERQAALLQQQQSQQQQHGLEEFAQYQRYQEHQSRIEEQQTASPHPSNTTHAQQYDDDQDFSDEHIQEEERSDLRDNRGQQYSQLTPRQQQQHQLYMEQQHQSQSGQQSVQQQQYTNGDDYGHRQEYSHNNQQQQHAFEVEHQAAGSPSRRENGFW